MNFFLSALSLEGKIEMCSLGSLFVNSAREVGVILRVSDLASLILHFLSFAYFLGIPGNRYGSDALSSGKLEMIFL